ncbi:hypothetical protein [Ideonella sp. A 288]|uniref:hypothetical protein n=1 Tax=Ideonella sp. A 288 TaxID=1962181 RepID=UPI000B4C1269|nr:hypothetical protein [Ideonella sp. A 288]
MITKAIVGAEPGRTAAVQGTRPAWWKALRETWEAPPMSVARVGVQHLILHASDVEIVRTALGGVGASLGLSFELDRSDGEIVLLDADVMTHMSPQLVAAFKEGRPTVLVCGLRAGRGLSPAARVAQVRQQLRRQLSRVSVVRERSPRRAAARRAPGVVDLPRADQGSTARRTSHPGHEAHVDALRGASGAGPLVDRLAQGEGQVLQRAAQGWRHLDAPPLLATYGSDAHLRFDFRTRQALCDPKAMQFLCAQHEVPQPAAHVWPGADACVHPLDLAIWHLGIAGAGHPLDGAPDDWWNLPWRACAVAVTTAERCTRVPSHLDIVRRLAAGPVTPASLRCQGQVSATDLRRVLQACLMLGLATWVTPGAAAGPA